MKIWQWGLSKSKWCREWAYVLYLEDVFKFVTGTALAIPLNFIFKFQVNSAP